MDRPLPLYPRYLLFELSSYFNWCSLIFAYRYLLKANWNDFLRFKLISNSLFLWTESEKFLPGRFPIPGKSTGMGLNTFAGHLLPPFNRNPKSMQKSNFTKKTFFLFLFSFRFKIWFKYLLSMTYGASVPVGCKSIDFSSLMQTIFTGPMLYNAFVCH